MEEVKEYLQMKAYLRVTNRTKIFGQALLLFLLQISMESILFYFFFRKGSDAEGDGWGQFPNAVSILYVGYIVVVCLHVFVQPQVLNSVQCMKYLYTHSKSFDNTFVPLIMILMKLIIELCVEVTGVLCSFTLNNDLWIVMCYITLNVVMNIDKWYFEMLDNAIK